MEQQKKEQAYVELGIEKGTFLKQQPHPVSLVRSFVHRRALALATPHEKHIATQLLQSQARLVNSLVGDQVIDDRYYYPFQDTLIFCKDIKTTDFQRKNCNILIKRPIFALSITKTFSKAL